MTTFSAARRRTPEDVDVFAAFPDLRPVLDDLCASSGPCGFTVAGPKGDVLFGVGPQRCPPRPPRGWDR